MSDERSRTITWHDPKATASAAMRRSGLDHLRAMKNGRIPPPPIITMTNMDLAEVEEGSVEFRCRPDESHDNTLGRVHGGFVCTVLDSAAGCAVQSTLPAGVDCTSLDLSVSYLRGVHLDSGELLAVGTVVKPGRRVAFAPATVVDSEGRLVAAATSTLLVFPVAEAG
ncbi:PaaI family thioesterase [Rathayibacter sp. VKM Ac-2630]|uniref:PaaI family thioesterase n=1 Tax=Rathayibacter sp. VKM Ac-2630 TaxID=1938617 RepID=UPI000981BD6F|nr:PaaI family thioesterase [Rathayibacter sp. VKM Ac-2630]OOB91497.1 aromatic compound degradation protein PaaI [Rathayibacter sp. VKM Ac-2630]